MENKLFGLLYNAFLDSVHISDYAVEIKKHSFISTVRPAVHTNSLRKRSWSKRSSKWKNLKTPAFRFLVDEKTLCKRSFSKTIYSILVPIALFASLNRRGLGIRIEGLRKGRRGREWIFSSHNNHVIYLPVFCSNPNPNWPARLLRF